MDNEELGKKIDEYHKEVIRKAEINKRRAEMYQWMNIGFIAVAFALAILSNYIATQNCIHALFTIIFLIFALGSCLYAFSSKFKENSV